MASLEAAIDNLYKEPLGMFVSARTTLAKTLSGADAKRVKGLTKPTAVAWAVNQLHWHDRATYDRVVKTGAKLRAAQIAALNGRAADVRGASATHRTTVGDAVKAATRLASADGVNPDADALARMLEAISLTTEPPEPHGRFTKALVPAGFEALAGVEIAPAGRMDASRRVLHEVPKRAISSDSPPKRESPRTVAQQKQALQAERDRLAAERKKQAAIRKAESAVAEARAAETRTREAWHRAKDAVDDAQRMLDLAKK